MLVQLSIWKVDFLPVMTGSLDLLQPHSLGDYTLNFSVWTSWFHLCIESYTVMPWRLALNSSFFRSYEHSHTHTQTQIVVSSASTALDLLSVFPLSCSDVDQGPTIMLLAPLLCTSHTTNLSQVEVREILMTVFYDSCLTELVNMVVPEYYYI